MFTNFKPCVAAVMAALCTFGAAQEPDRASAEILIKPTLNAPIQDRDYRNSTLFADNHGEFMNQRRRWEPQLQARYLHQPNQEIGSEPGDLDLSILDFKAEVPLIVDPDGYVLLGGRYQRRKIQSALQVPFTDDEDLHMARLIFGGGYFMQDDVLLEVKLAPGYHSDFNGGLHGDDFRLDIFTRLEWRYDETLFFKVGLDFDETYVDVDLLPIIGVSWMPDSQWRVDVELPRFAEVSYAIDPSITLFAGIEVVGNEYHVRGDRVGGIVQRQDINLQEIRIGLGGTYRFDDNISMFGRLGTNVAGDYRYGDGGGTALADGTLEPAFFFEVGFGYDF